MNEEAQNVPTMLIGQAAFCSRIYTNEVDKHQQLIATANKTTDSRNTGPKIVTVEK
jgi:hypothetical protein